MRFSTANAILALFICFSVAVAIPLQRSSFKQGPRSPPRPEAVSRQATRNEVIARIARGPASPRKRQSSGAPYPKCPGTKTTGIPYAFYFGAQIQARNLLNNPTYTANLQDCSALCEATPGCEITFFFEDPEDQTRKSCTPFDSGPNKFIFPRADASGSIRGVTCATAGYEVEEGITCCNARV